MDVANFGILLQKQEFCYKEIDKINLQCINFKI